MNKDQLIEKWQERHHLLLAEYSKGNANNEVMKMYRGQMKDILEFISDVSAMNVSTEPVDSINNDLHIPDVSVSLPDDQTIAAWAWEKCQMPVTVAENSIKLKFYSMFVDGAMLMRDWIKDNER